MEISGRIDVENIKKVKIDERDKKILYILSKEARKSYNDIAKEVLISPDSVKYRIERLKKNNVIIKHIPYIAFRHFGYFKYSVFFQIVEISDEKEREFINYLIENKNIISLMRYTDKYDFECVILARDINEFDCILKKIINEYSDIIDDVNTFQQVRSYKSIFLPDNYAKITKDPKIMKKKLPEKVKVDRLDLDILSALNLNARESSYVIADRLKTSVDTVLYRIKRMEEKGIIHRWTTIINFSMVGYNWYTFLLSLKSLTDEKERELKEFVRGHNNIIRAVRGIGEWNIIIYMIAFSQPEFHMAVNSLRTRFRSIIKDYDTLLGYREYKFDEFERFLYDVLE